MINKIRTWIGYIAMLFFFLMLWAGWKDTVWGLNSDSALTVFIWFIMLVVIGVIIPDDKEKEVVCLECKSPDLETEIEKSNLHFKKQTVGNTPRPYKNVKPENNPLMWSEKVNYKCTVNFAKLKSPLQSQHKPAFA